MCDKLLCPSGTFLANVPGKCCPICQPSAVDASPGVCDLADFDANIKKLMLGTNAVACMVDNDCAIAPLGGNCRSDCGAAVNASWVMLLSFEIQQFSAAYCTGCATTGGGCTPVSARCVNGRCTPTALPL
jgi:hypothetical protein